jgi:peptidoglycan/LPS O-acetylase OafA/YrhL
VRLLPNDGKPNHQPELDGFRGLAVLFVLLAHSSFAGYDPLGIDFNHFGSVGVYLFFVLSAYLINRQMLEALATQRATLKFWLRYALRRVLRIYPMYLLALIASYLLFANGFGGPIHNADDILKHLSLTEAKGVFWTIPVEVAYYLISPLLVLALWPLYRVRPWLAMLLLLTATLALWYTRFLHLPMPLFLRFAPVLAFGTLLAMAQRRLRLPGGIGLALFALILTTVPSAARALYGVSIFHSYTYTAAYGLTWALILYQALYHEVALSALGRWKPLRYLGTLSFSIYLLHLPVLSLCQALLPKPWVMPAFVAGTLLASFLTFTFVERPMAQIKFRS